MWDSPSFSAPPYSLTSSTDLLPFKTSLTWIPTFARLPLSSSVSDTKKASHLSTQLSPSAAMASVFNIAQHVIEASHIREYARATSHSQDEKLHLHVKQYIPKDNLVPRKGDVTIIGAHANGFPKANPPPAVSLQMPAP